MQTSPFFWLALQRALHKLPLIANQLLDVFITPEIIFEEAPLPLIRRFDQWDECEQDIKRCEKDGIRIITLVDDEYPHLLREIPARPVLIMVRGDAEILNVPCVSIVGARKATSHGRQVAFEIARGLAGLGIVVVSGMAYGIDASAHMGALETGKTAAVWGSGIDRCYPASFYDLSKKIEANGCIVSEFPLGERPIPPNFPQRNRIISGLSVGTVIVEAASKSGSLITANYALEQGREVLAVPGPAGYIVSAGTNELLRCGATFVENAEDVLLQIVAQISSFEKNPRHLSSTDNNGRPQ